MSGTLPYDPDQLPRGSRRALLDRTPRGATLLDVGCWSGFAGRYLRAVRAATVDGVEPVAEMAARAAEQYRRVIPLPIEVAMEELRNHGPAYDVVLFLDVLEHLVRPDATLRAARDLLLPGGRALVSIPNIAHWSVRKELMLGRWRYADSGLLDRTHLRFYTQETARELLADTGWRVRHEDSAIDRVPGLRPSPRVSDVLRKRPGLFAVQLLFEAVPYENYADPARL